MPPSGDPSRRPISACDTSCSAIRSSSASLRGIGSGSRATAIDETLTIVDADGRHRSDARRQRINAVALAGILGVLINHSELPNTRLCALYICCRTCIRWRDIMRPRMSVSSERSPPRPLPSRGADLGDLKLGRTRHLAAGALTGWPVLLAAKQK
jgi:hypothetical protein